MSDNFCPSCGAPLPLESINLTEGVALCPSCSRLSRLSEVADRKRSIEDVLSQPPPGCSITERGRDIVVRATLRSLTAFVGTLFVTLFWNGIVSVFLLIAIAGLYVNLIGPLPEWFPAPEMDEEPMSLGMTLFLCIFLTPFVAIGSLMFGALVLTSVGKVEVRIGTTEASVRTGVGFLVWRRRFDPTQVHRVSMGKTKLETNGRPDDLVVIVADRTIKFGSLLTDERREWLRTILHEVLTNPNPDRIREIIILASSSAQHPRYR